MNHFGLVEGCVYYDPGTKQNVVFRHVSWSQEKKNHGISRITTQKELIAEIEY